MPAPAARTGRVHLQEEWTLSTTGPSAIYSLEFPQYNGIPADLAHTVTSNDLAAIRTRYHAERPGLQVERWFGPIAPSLGGGFIQRHPAFPAPAEWTEYVGPVTDRVVWNRTAQVHPLGSSIRLQMSEPTVFPAAGRRAGEDWLQGPIGLGAAPPGFCGYCRVNPNILDPTGATDLFDPTQYLVDSTTGHGIGVDSGGDLRTASTWKLYRDGTRVPPTQVGLSNVPAFALGPDAASYRLESTFVLPKTAQWMPSQVQLRTGTRIDTAWTFASRRTPGRSCQFYIATHCAQQPLIQLRYRLPLDLADRVPAAGDFGFDVTATAPAGAAGGAPVTGLTVSYSTDEGKTWQAARAGRQGRGTFHVVVHHPPLASTGGFVWLRTRAADAAGNTVDQTIQRAYILTDGEG